MKHLNRLFVETRSQSIITLRYLSETNIARENPSSDTHCNGKFKHFFFLSALRVDKAVLFSLRNCLIVFHAFVRNCLELIPLRAVFCLFQNTLFTCVYYCFSQVLFIGLCSIQKYECISALLSQYVGCLLFHFEVI